MQRDESQPARVFVAHRPELHALASRMLGSSADADDAVQETWLRLARVPDPQNIDNPAGWLRTVVSRICLDTLRGRRARRDDVALNLTGDDPESDQPGGAPDPAEQAVLADQVGRAVLVVLDTLDPAERIAFVLHDMFDVPHVEIAGIVGRGPTATKKLASRARHKVRGTATTVPPHELAARRAVVSAFLAAARAGDLEAILAVLAPDVVRRADAAALPADVPLELRGARPVAEGTVLLAARADHAEIALVDGSPGLVLAPRGRLTTVLRFTVRDGLIRAYDVIADPEMLAAIDLAVLS